MPGSVPEGDKIIQRIRDLLEAFNGLVSKDFESKYLLHEKEFLDLYSYAVDSDFYFFGKEIDSLTSLLYSEKPEFIESLTLLVDKNKYLSKTVEDLILKNPDTTIKIYKHIQKEIKPKEIVAGILVSPLLKEAKYLQIILNDLKNEDEGIRFSALFSIRFYLDEPDRKTKYLIKTLLNYSPNLNITERRLYIQSLALISSPGLSRLNLKLNKIINKGELNDIQEVLVIWKRREDIPIKLFKKAILKLQKEDRKLASRALAHLTKLNLKLALKVFKKSIRRKQIIRIDNHYFFSLVSKSNYSSFLMRVEKVIAKNQKLIHYLGLEDIIEIILEDHENLFQWCISYKDDIKKQKLILIILRKILTNLVNYNPDSLRDKVVIFIKDLVKAKGLDFTKLTANIERGKDKKTGSDHLEITLKCLEALYKLLFPKVKINTKTLEKNLKRFPYVCKALGEDWLLKSAESEQPHYLCYIYEKIFRKTKLRRFLNKKKRGIDEKTEVYFLMRNRHITKQVLEQDYWEEVFKIIELNKYKRKKKKLRNPASSVDILAELEIISRLHSSFLVKQEPNNVPLSPKVLDLEIKKDSEKALIEVKHVKIRDEQRLKTGIQAMTPGGKIKSILKNTFDKQLKKGISDPKVPIVILLCLDPGIDFMDVQNALYGRLERESYIRNRDKKLVQDGFNRKKDGFFEMGNTEIVSLIGVYHRDVLRNDALVGRFFSPPEIKKLLNPITRSFKLEFRDALFGRSERSNWRSLLHISSIDENKARKLYDNGIETIDTLASIKENYIPEDIIEKVEIRFLKKEAIRVLNLMKTRSTKFLKGVDNQLYKELCKNEIFIIDDLYEHKSKPQDIPQEKWEQLKQDVFHIFNSRTDSSKN